MLKKLINIILLLSLIVNIILGIEIIFTKIAEKKAITQIKAQQINEKALTFAKLFVEKVMQGQNEISFEDRLQLENAVREVNDKNIFSQWQKFTKAKTNQEAQEEASILFLLLLNKILY